MDKELLRNLTRSWVMRRSVRIVMTIAGLMSRLASVLRTSALFPTSPNPICHWTVTIKFPENIICGQGVVIGPKTTVGAKGGVTFGDHVRISEGVMIESAGLDFSVEPPYPHIAKPIVIEHGVWIGARAIILAGVTIGQRSIIGAGAVVTRSVPPNSVVVGTAGTIRSWRDPPKTRSPHRDEGASDAL